MADDAAPEKQALQKLDEETREVAWDEFDKEADRELDTGRLGASWFGRASLFERFGRPRLFHRVKGDPEPEPVDDGDPGDERGLRDALQGDAEKS
jgi:hypothetical protein